MWRACASQDYDWRGNTYTVSLYSNSAATGIRSLMALQAAEVDIAVLTLRVELIEEPVLI